MAAKNAKELIELFTKRFEIGDIDQKDGFLNLMSARAKVSHLLIESIRR